MMKILARPAFNSRFDNPYNWLLYTPMKDQGVRVEESSLQKVLFNRYDIWHLHWPELALNDKNPLKAFLRSQALLLQINWARSRGTKIIWTIHNLAAHDQLYPQLEKNFWSAFIQKLDGYISLSETSRKAALERFPALKNIPGFVIPHGHYRGEYPDCVSNETARIALEIPSNAQVLLCFGRIRPYKNLTHLTKIFREISDSKLLLYIVGYPDIPDLAEQLKKEAALDSRIQLQLEFVPKDKTQLYFRAADLVILPYREILNSGTALLALSFDRPILVPIFGSLSEMQSQVGQEWVRTYAGELNALEIEEALTWAINTPRPQEAPLNSLDWQELAQKTIHAYQLIAANSLIIPR